MKLYCPCGLLVADIKGLIRKQAVMVCSTCMGRYKLADSMARRAKHTDKKLDMPLDFEELLGGFGHKQ